MARLWLLRFFAICVAVPVLFSSSASGRTGWTKGFPGVISSYMMVSVASPRWP